MTLLAPNPSLFTGPGTNTYVVTDAGEALVIDPGPVIDVHLDAIRRAIEGIKVVGVVVTHTHPDHAPAANPLGEELGVPVYGFADGPEFVPTHRVGDGDTIGFGDERLIAVHTPGHTEDHVCFRLGDELFTGDHIMGGSTVIIEDAAAYMESLHKVLGLRPKRLLPGHGPEIEDAEAMITEYIEHRVERERQILEALADGAGTIGDIVLAVYADVDPALHFAAAMQVRAQLQKLEADGRVVLPSGEAELGVPVILARQEKID